MAKVHVIANRKGGVGKTLISINMAAVTSDVRGLDPDGKPRIAYATADPQGDGPDWADRVKGLPFDFLDISEDLDGIQYMRQLPYDHVFVDTPGWLPIKKDAFEAGQDPLGGDYTGDLLRAIFAQAHDVIVPMFTEGQSFLPTLQTVEYVLKPRKLPHQVLLNNWAPSEGEVYVEGARNFCKNNGLPVANTVIRRYRNHANASTYGLVVTQYKPSSTTAKAREDFYKWALEHGLSGAATRFHDLTGSDTADWAAEKVTS